MGNFVLAEEGVEALGSGKQAIVLAASEPKQAQLVVGLLWIGDRAGEGLFEILGDSFLPDGAVWTKSASLSTTSALVRTARGS